VAAAPLIQAWLPLPGVATAGLDYQVIDDLPEEWEEGMLKCVGASALAHTKRVSYKFGEVVLVRAAVRRFCTITVPLDALPLGLRGDSPQVKVSEVGARDFFLRLMFEPGFYSYVALP